MAQLGEKIVRRLACERGDVLMEYVILTVSVMIPLVVAQDALFNPAAAWSGDLGYFGEQFVGWMQRMLNGVALPVP